MAKICPLMFAKSGRIIEERIPQPCLGEKCMWWVDGECAVTVIAKIFKEKSSHITSDLYSKS